MIRLDEAAWISVPSKSLLLVPLGSTEQHGPHLPFSVDTVIAEAVSREAGRRLGAVVAPALAYGSSGEHQQFAGTLSIGQDALRILILELVRSAGSWASRMVLINGHGGNVPVLSEVVPTLRGEHHNVAWIGISVPGGDAHAGRTETSLMLHIDKPRVGVLDNVTGDTQPISDLMSRLRAGLLREITASGILGDPRGSTASEGEEIFTQILDNIVSRIRLDRVGAEGELRAVL